MPSQLARTTPPHTRSPPDVSDPGAPCVPRVAVSPPASFPPRLTTTQLPLACGWCHQPPQGTLTPESLVMSGVHRVGARLALAPPTPPGVRVRTGRFAQHPRKRR